MSKNLAWSEQERHRLRMLYPLATWSEIKAAFPSRNMATIRARASQWGIRRIYNGGTPSHQKKAQPWTQDEAATAAEIWREELGRAYGFRRLPRGARLAAILKIAEVIGRTRESVLARLEVYGSGFASHIYQTPIYGVPPTRVLAERDRRSEAADARDLTGFLMGDPPRGYSALDCLQKGLGHERTIAGSAPDSVNHGRDS